MAGWFFSSPTLFRLITVDYKLLNQVEIVDDLAWSIWLEDPGSSSG